MAPPSTSFRDFLSSYQGIFSHPPRNNEVLPQALFLLDQGTKSVHHFRLKNVPHVQEQLPSEPRCLDLKPHHDLHAHRVPSEVPKLPTPAPGSKLLLRPRLLCFLCWAFSSPSPTGTQMIVFVTSKGGEADSHRWLFLFSKCLECLITFTGLWSLPSDFQILLCQLGEGMW